MLSMERTSEHDAAVGASPLGDARFRAAHAPAASRRPEQ